MNDPRNAHSGLHMRWLWLPSAALPIPALTQDIRLHAGLQRGLHQPGFTHLALSSEERRVINMHRNLERYLNLSADLPEADRMSFSQKVPT